MDLTLSGEQESIRDTIRGVLAERLPLARVRAIVADAPGFDAEVWRAAGTLGWLGLGVPDAVGGTGYGLPEEMILAIELGRALAPGPWLGTLLAAHALGSSPILMRVHARVLAGEHPVAVIDDAEDALVDGARLSGTATGVADAGPAAGFLVLGEAAVRYLPSDAPGIRVSVRPSIDPTRRLAHVVFDRLVGEPLPVEAAGLRRMATVLVAAEAVGVAERTLEMSVAYAKVRHQFGKPIGSFQAVKHRCADMAVRAEVARSATTLAAVTVRDDEPEAALHAHVAKALAASGAIQNATDNVQNHGGIGYTWEADPHLFLKRARLLEHAFGSRLAHLDALAAPWRAARPR